MASRLVLVLGDLFIPDRAAVSFQAIAYMMLDLTDLQAS
jgi:vacuolar protein sorting-associated protein 29